MQTIWEIKETEATDFSALDFPVSHLAKQLFHNRSLLNAEDINRFLFPKLENLHDPFLMKGMKEAVRRILKAVHRKELIMVHGDYDVDGITGAALLSRTLKKMGASYYAFLPHRKRDGYGVSGEAIQIAKTKGVSLLITVDCGISAHDEMQKAKDLGIDVIILDHHQIHGGNLPHAFAILNPLQEDCAYPFKELSACGLAFKLAQALIGNFAFSFLDLAALSSVCDVAPLLDENRIIVKHGLDLISSRKNPGLAQLMSIAKMRTKKANVSHIGFVLGPRINACGRMSSAEKALTLLVTDDDKEAETLAQNLDQENKTRQKEDKDVLKRAIDQVERTINFNQDRVVVVWGPWHQGVIGIVAQRLVERYGRPSFVIGIENGIGKGSARSLHGFHLFNALKVCEADLEEFGGHELAAGFSVSESKLELFRKNLNRHASTFPRDAFAKSIRVDLEISFNDLSSMFLRELAMFEPFGAGNPKPVFLSRGLTTKKGPIQVSPTVLKWWVTDGVSTFEAVWTQRQGIEKTIPDEGSSYDIVYSPSLKEQDGIETVLLEIRDVKGR